ncbi:hypothetical protein C0J52_24183 [Blattella germanica]|nr:hypothetical protein C0J52_24183 [Blattella germanica]
MLKIKGLVVKRQMALAIKNSWFLVIKMILDGIIYSINVMCKLWFFYAVVPLIVLVMSGEKSLTE